MYGEICEESGFERCFLRRRMKKKKKRQAFEPQ
jgi:hypothetical protein